MSKIEQYSRFEFHTVTTSGYTGNTFTVPNNDSDLNTWEVTDLGKSEIGVNEFDERVFIRIGDNIREFELAPTGDTNYNAGVITLTGGTANVLTSLIQDDSMVFLTAQNNSTNNGTLYVSTRSANTFFRISSSNTGDTSNVAWFIINP